MEAKPGLTQLMKPIEILFQGLIIKVHPHTYISVATLITPSQIKAFRECVRREPKTAISPLLHPVIQDELYKLQEEECGCGIAIDRRQGDLIQCKR